MKADRAQLRATALLAARAAIESHITTADVVARLSGGGNDAWRGASSTATRLPSGRFAALAAAR